MDRRYELRREELEAAAAFDPDLLRGTANAYSLPRKPRISQLAP
jgi:hypothetical protein